MGFEHTTLRDLSGHGGSWIRIPSGARRIYSEFPLDAKTSCSCISTKRLTLEAKLSNKILKPYGCNKTRRGETDKENGKTINHAPSSRVRLQG